MHPQTFRGINLLVVEGDVGGREKLRVNSGPVSTCTTRKEQLYVCRRHVNSMTNLSEALSSCNWDLIMVKGRICFTLHGLKKQFCTPSQTAALITAWWARIHAKEPNVAHPLILLLQKDWDEVEEWIDPLRSVGLPWATEVGGKEKSFMFFSDYHSITGEEKKGEKDETAGTGQPS